MPAGRSHRLTKRRRRTVVVKSPGRTEWHCTVCGRTVDWMNDAPDEEEERERAADDERTEGQSIVEYCPLCTKLQPTRVIEHPNAFELVCAVCGARTDWEDDDVTADEEDSEWDEFGEEDDK